MKKTIRTVDAKQGIVQVTFADERFYFKPHVNVATGIPEYLAVPSVTWIAGFYPKGIGFWKWMSEHGWDESQAIKSAAGDKGSKVHDAISAILRGEEVRIDSKFFNRSSESFEELTLEECDCILSFLAWREEAKPETIAFDVTVFSEKWGYAGTIDYICKIGDKIYIVDFKTSQQVWPEYELQVSAYREPLAFSEMSIDGLDDVTDIQLAVLQIGYKRNKSGFKWNEIENKFDLFLAARKIWANETEGQQPKKRDYPIVLSPARTSSQVEGEPTGVPEEGKKSKSKSSK